LSGKYRVVLLPNAEETYRRIYKDAQGPLSRNNATHPKVKLLRIIDECLNTIIPHDATSSRRALSGALAGFYRVKKGRMRICYAVAEQDSEILIMYISETPRKQGDKNDPYAVFTKIVMSGEYDEIFAKLGVEKPNRNSVGPVVIH
jgi:mRNA-degrading endonuclease RelE of RelBE toxin-antitoxin system